MGYIYGPYTIFIYLLTYYFRFRSGTRVPVVLPDGYPGNKLPGYGSPSDDKHRRWAVTAQKMIQDENF